MLYLETTFSIVRLALFFYVIRVVAVGLPKLA